MNLIHQPLLTVLLEQIHKPILTNRAVIPSLTHTLQRLPNAILPVLMSAALDRAHDGCAVLLEADVALEVHRRNTILLVRFRSILRCLRFNTIRLRVGVVRFGQSLLPLRFVDDFRVRGISATSMPLKS